MADLHFGWDENKARGNFEKRGLRILVVCHCYRESSGLIPIYSVRKATRKERAQYGTWKP